MNEGVGAEPERSRLKRLFLSDEFFLAAAAALAGAASAFVLLMQNRYALVYYGDAISHLVISRRIVDWIDPGLAQVGSVWLPMTHIMLLPFVLNDFLFHTGLAGTIVSTFSMTVTTVVLYRMAKLQFKSRLAGFVASSLYLMNPSVLYMGVVPMMEANYVMFLVLSVYYLQQWYYSTDTWKQYRNLLKCSFAASAATLTRYEAWVLPFALIFILLVVLMIIRREAWRAKARAFLWVVIPFSFLGTALWLLWNLAIFRDPLYFADAPYFSAQAQALSRPFRQHLYLQPINSASILFDVARNMYGIQVLALAALGLAAYVYLGRRERELSFRLLTLALLLSPTIAVFLAMVQGSGEVYPVQQGWFNGLFLVEAAPFLAFASASLVSFAQKRGKKALTVFVVLLVGTSYGLTLVNQGFAVGANTVLRAPILPYEQSEQVTLQTGTVLGSIAKEGQIVLFVTASDGDDLMFSSGLPLNRFIDVAAGSYWKTSVTSPWVYGEYLVMAEQPSPEIQSLLSYWQGNQSVLMEHFTVVYANQQYLILKNDNASSPQAPA
ncbi:MAG: hypothetical protein JRM88_04105 [Nitrososphaerota archaeon]|nr:hypothetical protein [Nitrososphaerota archaeon]